MSDIAEVPGAPSTYDYGLSLSGVEQHLDGPYDFQWSRIDKWNNPTGTIQGKAWGPAIGIKAQMRSFSVADGT